MDNFTKRYPKILAGKCEKIHWWSIKTKLFLSRKLSDFQTIEKIVNRQTNQKPKEVNILVFNETYGDLKQSKQLNSTIIHA